MSSVDTLSEILPFLYLGHKVYISRVKTAANLELAKQNLSFWNLLKPLKTKV